MATKTPQSLPTSGRLFTIRLPADEEWFSKFMGNLQRLVQEWCWVQSVGGVSVEDTVQAFEEALAIGYDDGVPE